MKKKVNLKFFKIWKGKWKVGAKNVMFILKQLVTITDGLISWINSFLENSWFKDWKD